MVVDNRIQTFLYKGSGIFAWKRRLRTHLEILPPGFSFLNEGSTVSQKIADEPLRLHARVDPVVQTRHDMDRNTSPSRNLQKVVKEQKKRMEDSRLFM